ncbi:MAG: glycosyltransferase [Pseudomonadota bacterium]
MNPEEKLRRLRRPSRVKIKVKARSDNEPDPRVRLTWGDYWVKVELVRELELLGLEVVEDGHDVLLYLFGGPKKEISPHAYNLVWVYSHPDQVTAENLRGFDRVFSLSESFSRKLGDLGVPRVETMIAATSKKPTIVPLRYDVVFVGNARGSKADGRDIIGRLGRVDYNLKVWGTGWDKILPAAHYGGPYWDYRELENLYAAAKISLSDHHADMAREGFVAARVFDVLASGGFVISDRNPGIDDIFGPAVPQYHSPEDLRELVEYYLGHDEERERLRKQGQEIALSHAFRDRARQFVRDFWPGEGREGQ